MDPPLDKRIEVDFDNSKFDASQVRVEDLHDKVNGVKVLRNVLTKEECYHILNIVFGDEHSNIPAGAKPVLFRGWSEDAAAETAALGKRCFFEGPRFASMLWDRVKSFAPTDVSIVSDTSKANWKVHGLSKRIRFVVYSQKENFPAHMDGPEVINTTCQSFYSILFYLDAGGDDFQGGELQFLRGVNEKTKEVEVIAEIVPEPGLVIIMPHKLLHHSVPIVKGTKFMIRNNILFNHTGDETVTKGTPNTPPYI